MPNDSAVGTPADILTGVQGAPGGIPLPVATMGAAATTPLIGRNKSAVSSAASLTTAAPPAGQRWIITEISATLAVPTTVVGAAAIITLTLQDGAGAVHSWDIGIPLPVGSSVTFILTGVALQMTVGNTVTLGFSAGITNLQQTVDISGY